MLTCTSIMFHATDIITIVQIYFMGSQALFGVNAAQLPVPTSNRKLFHREVMSKYH